MNPLSLTALALLLSLAQLLSPRAEACTGINLIAADGSVIVARTNEWGASDMDTHLTIFPRGRAFQAMTPGGVNGAAWKAKWGFVSMTAYGQPYGPDGLNERGLYVGMYYFPGFASYAPYIEAEASKSVSVGDLMQWMLSNCETVDEALVGLEQLSVVNVDDPRFGGAALPFHWKIADPSGRTVVIEVVEGGKVEVREAVLGVITNSPGYDWHTTNLRNYLKLSPLPAGAVALDGTDLSPLGAGSGMLGLPGDFTPPSRFVRAAAFVASARSTATGEETVDEAFRILDSFNIPIGSVMPRDMVPEGVVGATQFTSACDLKNKRMYYHTMHNRRVRAVDLREIDFATIKEQSFPLDSVRAQDVQELEVR
jgi:choloylglycine hydrolase